MGLCDSQPFNLSNIIAIVARFKTPIHRLRDAEPPCPEEIHDSCPDENTDDQLPHVDFSVAVRCNIAGLRVKSIDNRSGYVAGITHRLVRCCAVQRAPTADGAPAHHATAVRHCAFKASSNSLLYREVGIASLVDNGVEIGKPNLIHACCLHCC